MEYQESAGIVDRLLLVSGTSGVGLRELYTRVKSEARYGACAAHFEDILLGLAGLPRGYSIVHLVTMATVSRPQVVEQFKRAVGRLSKSLSGCKSAIVFSHISYIVKGSIFPNPVIRDILGLGRWRGLLYLMDDYYDAFSSIYRKAESQSTPHMTVYLGHYVENVDSLAYMEWRGYDLNQLGRLEAQGIVDEIHILAVKHPWKVLERLLGKLLGQYEYRTVYVSHPISAQRSLYSRLPYEALSGLKGPELGSMPLVLMIESFKEALLEAESLIPFSPTTIDEYVTTNAKVYYEERYKCPDLIKERLGCQKIDFKISDGRPVPSLYLVRAKDRWPLPRDTIRENLGISGDEDIIDIVKILSKADLLSGRKVFEEPTIETMILMEICQEWMAIAQWRSSHYLTQASRKLYTHIRQQIEMRDYQYVAQSDSTLAILPVIIVDDSYREKAKIGEGLYLLKSQGMEAEIHRAKALGKPIQVVLLPVCLRTISEWLGKYGLSNIEQEIIENLINNTSKCEADTRLPSDICKEEEPISRIEDPGPFMSCINRLVHGQIFGHLGGGVSACLSRTLYSNFLDPNIDKRRLVEAYADEIRSCG